MATDTRKHLHPSPQVIPGIATGVAAVSCYSCYVTGRLRSEQVDAEEKRGVSADDKEPIKVIS